MTVDKIITVIVLFAIIAYGIFGFIANWRGWEYFIKSIRYFFHDVMCAYIRAKSRDRILTVIFLVSVVLLFFPHLSKVGSFLQIIFWLGFVYSISKASQEGKAKLLENSKNVSKNEERKQNNMFDCIRAGLIESYKPRPIDDVKCISCGGLNKPVSLHVLEFSQSENRHLSNFLVPMSKSYGTLRGSVPICVDCLPVCKKCGLSISTSWVDRIKGALDNRMHDVQIHRGNGICQHIHPISNLRDLFRKALIVDEEI